MESRRVAPGPTDGPRTAVLAALPSPDVTFDRKCPDIKYCHRSWRDADVYFLFNESDQEQTRTVTLTGSGDVQAWDAFSGDMIPMPDSISKSGKVQMSVTLKPYETRLLVVGKAP